MISSAFVKLRNEFFAQPFGGLASGEARALVSARVWDPLLESRRAEAVRSRVGLVAGVLAVATPLWTVVEYIALRPELWQRLALARLLATFGFIGILAACMGANGARRATRAIGALFAIPALFYLDTALLLEHEPLVGFARAVADTHVFLPFLILAAISIFPLTLIECLLITVLVLAAKALTVLLSEYADGSALLGSFWLLLLVAGVSTLASVGQLASFIILIRQAVRDSLTGCFSRRSGEELLEVQFALSSRSRSPLSLAYVDIDFFKRVNDEHGHEAGDRVLVIAVEHMSGQLRAGDVLVRWGGEEFILIMPGIDREHAVRAMKRMRDLGFGVRPEGAPLTASIGVAERVADRAADWKALVDLADARMYEAKRRGRDRIVARTEPIDGN